MLGLEIAPWFNPVASKKAGYNVRTLDVFDFETLMRRAKDDPKIDPGTYENLEPIDYVGSATEILQLVPEQDHGRFDYVISSHNFEHLPNPIKFLQGCDALLRPGGMIVMAVPDGRACFDYFRPHTVTADWLEAYVEDRRQPSERQLFAAHTDLAFVKDRADDPTMSVTFDTLKKDIENQTRLTQMWADWQSRTSDAPYMDAHCTVMTPASLQLLIEDCRALGLVSLDIQSVSSTQGVEFSIRLVKRSERSSSDAATYQARRTQLLHDIWQEQAVRHASARYGNAAIADYVINAGASESVSARWKRRLKLWNRKRLAQRRLSKPNG